MDKESIIEELVETQNQHYKKIINLLENYSVENKSQNAVIVDTRSGCYSLYDDEEGEFMEDLLAFFSLLEQCRLKGYSLTFSERQYFVALDSLDNNKKIPRTKSCLDFDFDIYTKEREMPEDSFYEEFIEQWYRIFSEVIDFNTCSQNSCIHINEKNINASNFTFYTAILTKEPRKASYKGEICWYISFHIRFFVKLTKETKILIRERLLEENIVDVLNINTLNDATSILDYNMMHNHCLFVGCSKPDESTYHQIHKLYKITGSLYKKSMKFAECDIDDQVKEVKVGRKTYNERFNQYNLCMELSLNFEMPNGLIHKPSFEVKSNVIELIRNIKTRTQCENENENMELLQNLSNLTLNDYNARYVRKLLEILPDDWAYDGQKWFRIMRIIAGININYMDIAIEFSMRGGEKWEEEKSKDLKVIKELWEKYKENPPLCNIGSLIYILKEVANEDYKRIKEDNIYSVINASTKSTVGVLNDIASANIVNYMWPNKFICRYITKKKVIWYEFITNQYSQIAKHSRSLYKWHMHSAEPKNLKLAIMIKLPTLLRKFLSDYSAYFDKRCDEVEVSENEVKYKQNYYANMNKYIIALGNTPMASRILSALSTLLEIPCLNDILDKTEYVLGVKNGILNLNTFQLIQEYNNYYVSRSTITNWVKYDPDNKYVQEIEKVIDDIFYEDWESRDFIMYYLATSLDGYCKDPYFLIFLGEGSNGKSVLAEFMANTLGFIDQGGYVLSLPIEFFMHELKVDANSPLMALEHARFAFTSESKIGVNLRAEIIKKLTSETLSGNDKFEKQRSFRCKCTFLCTTNHNPTIDDMGYGMWRRILAYHFKRSFVPKEAENCEEHELPINPDIINMWVKNEKYLKAFLSILVNYYKNFKEKYDGKLINIPHNNILEETRIYRENQDTYERYIVSQLEYTGKESDCLSIVEIIKDYRIWYTNNIKNNFTQNIAYIRDRIKSYSKLKAHFVERNKTCTLVGFRLNET